jgi:hypothetical protein
MNFSRRVNEVHLYEVLKLAVTPVSLSVVVETEV